MQHQRYVLLSFVVAAILVGLTLQTASTSLFEAMGVVDTRVAGLVHLSTLVSVGLGALTFGILVRHQRAVRFVDEVVDELYKVTWPTREETIRASTTVVFTTLFVAALIGVYDLVWKNVADIFLFNQG